MLPITELGDFVWIDSNGNGKQDANETGLAGVTVTLFDCITHQQAKDFDGVLVAPIVTGASGAYNFTNLAEGTYEVHFTLPNGSSYVFTTQDVGGNDGIDSDADATTGITGCYTLYADEPNLTVDAGLYKPVTIGNFVWNDTNADGIQNDGNTGIQGVKLNLTGTDGAGNLVTDTATTDADGLYNFSEAPGTYTVTLDASNFLAGGALYGATPSPTGQGTTATDSNSEPAGTTPVTLASGDADDTLDFGYYKTASLGDYVWADNNLDGVQNDGAASGLNGVTVNLLTAAGALVATTTTANDGGGNPGYYLFSNLTPGDYKVEFIKPAGYVFTTADAGADGSDSDANVSTGMTIPTTLVSGENDLSWDAGLVKLASIGDTVFVDKNANGVQDAGDTGIPGAAVELYTCVGGATGVLVASTTTNGSGNYSFTNLTPGDYIVKFITPAGYTETLANVGGAPGDAVDSDAVGGLTGCYTLAAGDNNTTVDAGFYQKASLGDYVWADNNLDGVQNDGAASGLNGVTVKLLTAAGALVATTTTANDGGGNPGYYLFSNLTPGDYKVEFIKPAGYVFTTADAGADGSDSDANVSTGMTIPTTLISGENDLSWDAGLVKLASLGDRIWTDTNANGQQDDGATGVNGLAVNLMTAGADNTFGTGDDVVVQTATTAGDGNYNFTGLMPGVQYQVQFSKPGGMVYTTPDQGSDVTDSDANVTSGRSQTVTLAAGENNTTVDAGVYAKASLGDYVWADNNLDGVQNDGAASGLNGVTVKLLTAAGALVATTTTANDGGGNPGYYLFSNLTPGDYKVEFIKPAGYNFTTKDAGAATDLTDSDANTATGQTIPTTLTSGENDLSWDAGLVTINPTIHLEKDVSPSPVAANVPVTYTYTVTNPGGPALANVTVIDNNATPGVPGDDFNPTPVLGSNSDVLPSDSTHNIGDANNDNLLDVGEAWKYTATLIPTVTMYVTTSTGTVYASGTLTYTTLGNGDIRVTYLQSNAINDNTYGTGSDAGWAAIGKVHQFKDLTGSDKAGFLVKYSDGTTLAQFYQDYITLGGTNTEGYAAFSGYQSLGFSGGDGSFVAGNSALVKDFDSTLETNLNQSGVANNGVAYTAMTVNSPVGDAKWNVVDGYSFVIDHTAFTAGKSFGGVTIFDQHNSPPKVGTTNSLIPYVVGGPVTNIAVASGTGGGSTVSDSDDATVQILGTPRKFYTVDPGTDKVYGYTAGGGLIATNSQQAGNTDAYGITGNADGTKLWVLDLVDKAVNVYKTDGTALGQWTATDMGTTGEGIALDGNDLWLLDRATRAIKWYDDAALRTSGTDTAEKSFVLPSAVNIAKGITTDGTTLWVVEDDTANTVFRYTIARDGAGTPTGLTAAGSWTLNKANTTPTGITLDPTGASNSLWVVDSGTDTVYEYGDGRDTASGAGFLVKTFKLGAANTNAQDIFDPEANFGIATDAAYVDLSAWRDTDGSHQTDAVELMSPAGAGIVSPDLSDLADTLMDASAYLQPEPGSVAMSGGQVAEMTGACVAVAANDAVAVDAPAVLEPGWLFG